MKWYRPNGEQDWHNLFTAYFTISPVPEPATYTYTVTYPYEEGTVTLTTPFTLTSGTIGSGATIWNWTDGNDSCSGGNDFSITQYQAVRLPGVQLLLFGD